MFKSTDGVRRRTLIALAAGFAGGAVALASASPASAQQIQLKLAHFLPTANGMHKDFLEPWARDLEKCSNGKVKVTIYPAGAQLGDVGQLYDEVSSGVVDITLGWGAFRQGGSIGCA